MPGWIRRIHHPHAWRFTPAIALSAVLWPLGGVSAQWHLLGPVRSYVREGNVS